MKKVSSEDKLFILIEGAVGVTVEKDGFDLNEFKRNRNLLPFERVELISCEKYVELFPHEYTTYFGENWDLSQKIQDGFDSEVEEEEF